MIGRKKVEAELVKIFRLQKLQSGAVLVVKVKTSSAFAHAHGFARRLVELARKIGGTKNIGCILLSEDESIELLDRRRMEQVCTMWLDLIKDDPDVGDAAKYLQTLLARRKVSKSLEMPG